MSYVLNEWMNGRKIFQSMKNICLVTKDYIEMIDSKKDFLS